MLRKSKYGIVTNKDLLIIYSAVLFHKYNWKYSWSKFKEQLDLIVIKTLLAAESKYNTVVFDWESASNHKAIIN